MLITFIAWAACFWSLFSLCTKAMALHRSNRQVESIRWSAIQNLSTERSAVESDSRPLYSLVSRCTKVGCGAERAHLLMNLTVTDADRQCVECGHEWKERIARE